MRKQSAQDPGGLAGHVIAQSPVLDQHGQVRAQSSMITRRVAEGVSAGHNLLGDTEHGRRDDRQAAFHGLENDARIALDP